MNNPKKNQYHFSFLMSLLMLAGSFLLFNFIPSSKKNINNGILKIRFVNTVNSSPLVLNDSVYKNVFGENYNVTKFRYYISNFGIKNSSDYQKEKFGYHLIDAKFPETQSFSFEASPGKYDSLFFIPGVDSLLNCSGAQTGALDPMNDMFWTWNSGYVMMKFEGISSSSSAINQRFEYHIGGYSGANNVLQPIHLSTTKPIIISKGKTTEIIIETNLSNWWRVGVPVSIKENPICSTPGPLAKKIADNYRNMFAIQTIKNN